MKVFLDTNVLLDVFGVRQPFFEASAAVWSLMERHGNEGFVSAISFANVFYIVRKIDDASAARNALRILREGFSVVACDNRVLSLAIDSGVKDYEDAIQYFSAREAGADYLVTRNARDFPRDSMLPIVSPAEFLNLLDERETE